MTAQLAHAADLAAKSYWLPNLRYNWARAVCTLLEDGVPVVVRVLIAEVRGSAPREPGACMLVSRAGIAGTIGGGHLEWQALQAAQALLVTANSTLEVRLRRLVLGRELAQCCGGVVQLWLERFTPGDLPLLRRAATPRSDGTCAAMLTELNAGAAVRRLVEGEAEAWRIARAKLCEPTSAAAGPRRLHFAALSEETAFLYEPLENCGPSLWLYGAGHVGQALIRILGELPFEVTWIDSRPELLPDALPENVRPLCTPTPTHTVPLAPPGARFLVMTHDHGLDYALVRKILERIDFTWLGLIGSKSKGARFRSRLARDGLTRETIHRLVCPIGMDGVASKWPAAIAVAVAAQLLQGLEAAGSRRDMNLSAAAGTAAEPEICLAADCAACSSRTA